jgi:hypothetical protein
MKPPETDHRPLAYKDESFLEREDARPLRILAEYIEWRVFTTRESATPSSSSLAFDFYATASGASSAQRMRTRRYSMSRSSIRTSLPVRPRPRWIGKPLTRSLLAPLGESPYATNGGFWGGRSDSWERVRLARGAADRGRTSPTAEVWMVLRSRHFRPLHGGVVDRSAVPTSVRYGRSRTANHTIHKLPVGLLVFSQPLSGRGATHTTTRTPSPQRTAFSCEAASSSRCVPSGANATNAPASS